MMHNAERSIQLIDQLASHVDDSSPVAEDDEDAAAANKDRSKSEEALAEAALAHEMVEAGGREGAVVLTL